MKMLLTTISMCSVLWIAGCASDKTDKSVARTLNSYQVGSTTFADLKRDSQIVDSEKTVNAVVTGSNPSQMAQRTVHAYDVPRHSHWRVFNSDDQSKTVNGSLVSQRRQLTVGSTDGPVYVLTFNEAGMLVDKRPAS